MVRSADRAGGRKLRGVPDGGHQPQDGDTLALRRTILDTAGEAVHYPPVRLTAPKAPHPRDLSLTERTTIADLHRAGVGVRGIAEELGRTPSTVSRELRRNADGRGRYLPATAGHRAGEPSARGAGERSAQGPAPRAAQEPGERRAGTADRQPADTRVRTCP